MKKSLPFLFALVLFFTIGMEQANAIKLPVEHFSKDSEFSQVKISPQGNYLAVMTKRDGKDILIIMDINTFKATNVVSFQGSAQVGAYYWVNNDRIVVSKTYLKGWQDHPVYHGELFGINADGSRGRYLVGYQGESQVGSRIKKATPIYGTSYVLDPLIHDKDKMLIVTYPWTSNNEPHTHVYEVNVYSGKRKRITRSPSSQAVFLTDHQGQVRVAVSSSDGVDSKIHIRANNDEQWKNFDLKSKSYSDIKLYGFNKAGNAIYISASENGDAAGFYKLNLKDESVKLIYKEGTVSPSKVWVDPITKEPFAIETELGYPNYVIVNKKSQKSKNLKALIQALNGDHVQLISSTEDGSQNVIRASSDRNAGEYYLFDANKNKLRFLFSSRKWLKKEKMAETKPIHYQSRDGLTIYGYLTLPNGAKNKKLPLVVMPHGGPHGPRDWWGFDPDVQLLANQGIAVLKVNFRGSGGFGRNFEHAGHRKWGAEIQYDIIDGVKHLISNGTVDKNNICIMGASFGGYSALQSAILEPDLFQCAIGVVGVYDLPLMFKEGDVAARTSGQRYLKRVLGEDQAQLKAFSPSYNIDKLKAPVLIVHGGEDERAPIEQAESLVKALKKANHPYQYELLEDEGHGFYNAKHRTRYYNQVLSFLNKHLDLD